MIWCFRGATIRCPSAGSSSILHCTVSSVWTFYPVIQRWHRHYHVNNVLIVVRDARDSTFGAPYGSSNREETMFEFLSVQYEVECSVQTEQKKRERGRKNEKILCGFKSKQNLVQVREDKSEGCRVWLRKERRREGERRKRKEVENRGRSVWVLSGVMKSVALFFFAGLGSAGAQQSERLADECLPSMRRHTLKHANTHTHTQRERL